MSEVVENSRKILNTTKETILSFLKIYDQMDDMEDDQKQDLLRAVILFSCSGMDAVIKQLINDSLEKIIKKDIGSENNFRVYIEKKIKNNSESYNAKLLSEIFISENRPKDTLIEILKRELTANSLQSVEELSKVASYFNIKTTNIVDIKEVFMARNQITHEMDIEDMNSKKIERRNRDKKQVEQYANKIINFAEYYIDEIENKL